MILAVRRFRSADEIEVKPEEPEWKKAITKAFQKFVIGVQLMKEFSTIVEIFFCPYPIAGLSFIYTKQPARIAQVRRK